MADALRLNVTGLISSKTEFGRFSVAGDALAAIGNSDGWCWNVGNVVFGLGFEGFVFVEHRAVHGSELNGLFVEFVVGARRFVDIAVGRGVDGIAGLNAVGQKFAGGHGSYSAFVGLHQLLLHLDHAFAFFCVYADAGHV